MGKLADFIKEADEHHDHCGINICGDTFYVYVTDIESYHRGEDSGARYPEYGSDKIILTICLESFYQEVAKGELTVKEILDALNEVRQSNQAASWGQWYTPGHISLIADFLDKKKDIDMYWNKL